jgi:hypothetical protein
MLDQALITLPSDFVLNSLFDEPDAFEDVGDVVNSPLLDLQGLGSFVQVDLLRGRVLYQVDEPLGKLTQAVIDSILLYSHDVVSRNVGVHNTSPCIQHVRIRTLVRGRTKTLENVVRQAPDGDDRGPAWGLIGVKCHPDIIQLIACGGD